VWPFIQEIPHAVSTKFGTQFVPGHGTLQQLLLAALPIGPLRLRGLQLATDRLHHPITGHVIGARREGSLVCNPSTGSFVQSQQLPTDGLVADSPAADLPNPHDGMIILGESNRVDFNATGEAVVLKLKDMTRSERFTGSLDQHFYVPFLPICNGYAILSIEPGQSPGLAAVAERSRNLG